MTSACPPDYSAHCRLGSSRLSRPRIFATAFLFRLLTIFFALLADYALPDHDPGEGVQRYPQGSMPAFERWDAAHFLTATRFKLDTEKPFAFFPLFPGLIRGVRGGIRLAVRQVVGSSVGTSPMGPGGGTKLGFATELGDQSGDLSHGGAALVSTGAGPAEKKSSIVERQVPPAQEALVVPQRTISQEGSDDSKRNTLATSDFPSDDSTTITAPTVLSSSEGDDSTVGAVPITTGLGQQKAPAQSPPDSDSTRADLVRDLFLLPVTNLAKTNHEYQLLPKISPSPPHLFPLFHKKLIFGVAFAPHT